jgi:hypothetical protein
MTQSIIIERAEAIATIPAFAVHAWWLTFSLTGAPPKLDALSRRLAERGCVNIEGAEGGFLYPKIEVPSNALVIARIVDETQLLVQASGAEVIAVDVDTSPDVAVSVFKELIRFDGSVRYPPITDVHPAS